MKKLQTLILLFLFGISVSYSQDKQKHWTNINESSIELASKERWIIPIKYNTVNFDILEIKKVLSLASHKSKVNTRDSKIIIELPLPNGGSETFSIVENSAMSRELAANFPEIKSYDGVSVLDKSLQLKLDITPKGLHAMISGPNHKTAFIDPYADYDTKNYIVYSKNNFETNKTMTCEVLDDVKSIPTTQNKQAIGDCQLRTYRLALAATGEYTQFHGGTKAAALAAQVTSINRVNQVFERDFAVTLIIIGNNSDIIYTNGSTDPYTNNDGATMLGENQSNVDAIIGTANYDIGHVYSTGGGGIASLRSPCSSSKARGVTGSGSPVGDSFDIDYVAHEMGHQFGGNHTQNNSCNRNSSTSMEPGSASSIMGYAGICSPNVQNQSDDVFHSISIQEISDFITGSGNSCAALSDNGNNAPSLNPDMDYTIPASTPFELEADATEPDGDAMTYQWDQMDAEVTSQPPSNSSTEGPSFQVLPHASSSTKSFPQISAVVSNSSPTWEVLSSSTRDYNFRLMVRDNHSGQGCTAQDDIVITTSAGSAFAVTSPNTSVSYEALTSQTITWDVANTSSSPVSTSNVDIFLSTDGGYTYPVTIGTFPNTGSTSIQIPNNITTQARIKVKGSGNIFYDISNTNFTITAATNPDFTLTAGNDTLTCAPNNGVQTIYTGSILSFSDPITLSASGNHSGTTVSFSPNPVTPGDNSIMTISNTGSATPGTSTITVTGIASSGTHNDDFDLTINSVPGQVSLTSPTNSLTGVSTSPSYSWGSQALATSYDIDIAADAGFTTIIDNATVGSNSYSGITLNTLTQYFWRVRSVNTCGNGTYSNTFSFTTANETCNNQASTNIPITISGMGTGSISSIITVTNDVTITDLNISNLIGTHDRISDLRITLMSPLGTIVELFNGICGANTDFDIQLDDEATADPIPCPATDGGSYQPSGLLSAFDGENSVGTWTLTIEDATNPNSGQLNAWSINICGTPPCITPNITGQPSNSTITENTNTSFSVTATGEGLSYQWQENSGSGFGDITSGGVYSGATTSTLTLTSVPIGMDTYTYRCLALGICDSVFSNSGTLTVTGGAPGPSSFHWSYDQIYGKQWGVHSPTTNTTVFIVPYKIGGASTYELEVNDASDFSGTAIYRIGNGPTPRQGDYWFGGLAINTTYYTRVKVDGGNWGTVKQFTTHNISISSYVAKTVDGTYGTNANVHKTSLFVVPKEVTGAPSYLVEVNTASNFGGTSYTKTGTGPNTVQGDYWFGDLAYGTTYYTRVSIDGGGTWGATKSFTTHSLGESNLDYFVDGQYGKQWAVNYPSPVNTSGFVVPKALVDASSYTVEICADSSFSDTATFATKTGTGPTVTKNNYWFGGLLNSTRYYVRVKTDLDPYGKIYWFTVEDAARPSARMSMIIESEVENIELNYLLYPNPFSEIINIKVDSKKNENLMVSVTDLTGRTVYQSTRHQTNQSIQLGEELGKGLYLIQLVHGDETELMKVIKK